MSYIQINIFSSFSCCCRFGVGKTQVSNLLKDRDSILKDWRENGMGGAMKKRMRKGSADVDAFVYEWFRNAQAQNIPVSGPLIQEKALEVAKALGNPEFKASNGWLCKFKSRHGINWRSSGEISDPAISGGSMDFGGTSADYCGASAEYSGASREYDGTSAEYGEASDESVRAEGLPLSPAVDWRSVLRNWCTGYADCDVYNCVETPLLFGALPNQKMFNSGGKTAKLRLTILLCANVAGDFEEPLIIGNTLPTQLENLRLRDLGFSWKVNQYSWMSPEIMNEWLDSFNLRMMVQKRTVVLILEDSKCHPHLDLSNVKLVFVPPNGRQPLDLGVVRSFKRGYRTKLLRHLLSNNQPRVSKLDAAMWTVSAIKDIKPAEVRRCFSEVGISEAKPDLPIQDTKPELDSLVQMMSADLSADDYTTSDNHLPTSYSDTDIQSIIETIKSCEDDEAAKDSSNPKPDDPPPEHKAALESLKQVEKLLLLDKNTSLYQKLYSIRLEIEKTYLAKCLVQNKNQVSLNIGHVNMTLNENECCYEFVDGQNSKSE